MDWGGCGFVSRSRCRCGFVDNRCGCRFVDDRCGSRLVNGFWGRFVGGCRGGFVSGFGVVIVGTGFTLISDIGDETGISIDAVDDALDAAVGQFYGIFAVGLVTRSLLLLVEFLVFIPKNGNFQLG